MSGALTVASLASVLTCLAIQAGWAVYLRQAPYVAAAHDPGVYELAYLAGGTPRVMTTALALLSHDGTVAITPGGRVSLLRHGRMADPAEAAAVRPLRLRARTAPVLSPPTGSLQTANVPTANVPALALLLAGRGLTVRPTGTGAQVLAAAHARYRQAGVPAGAGAPTGQAATRPAGSGAPATPGVTRPARLSVIATRVALEGPSALADPPLRGALSAAGNVAAADLGRGWRWLPGPDLASSRPGELVPLSPWRA